ncbi:hypothetical protein ACFMQL_33325 [Nonomuraea fastidiosa]|jgi:hypothetical protein|uniref:hypothetical protein n=2 Tax=Streptosporangiaceae TaxID=2004 RepID=UPI0034451350
MWWRRRKRSPYEPGVRAYGAWRVYADSVEGSDHIVDRKDNGHVYEVSWVKTEAIALEYLRRRDVRREGHYVIVETPHRDLGRDMIMIFDEADGSLIEIPERTPLPQPTPSPTHCARCGYPVLPVTDVTPSSCGDPDCGHPWHTADFAWSADRVILAGAGYRCTQCRSAACRACYEATGSEQTTITHGFLWDPDDEQPHPSDEILMRLCWICGSPVTILDE